MLGGRWTTGQKAAYRAAFSMGRIVDEVWLLIALAWILFCTLGPFSAIGHGAPLAVDLFAGLVVLGGATYAFAPSLLKRTMPKELVTSLPDGRFSGQAAPTAPRTYRELLRRWRRPRGTAQSSSGAAEQRDAADETR
jgi:hypothetical protein